jgi:CrcB protein
VNVLGSFLIGLYASLSEPDGRLLASPAQRQFVMAGFCGGFTTFSIFSLETLLLVDRQEFGPAIIYVAVSVALWLVSVWIGYGIGSKLNRLKRS